MLSFEPSKSNIPPSVELYVAPLIVASLLLAVKSNHVVPEPGYS